MYMYITLCEYAYTYIKLLIDVTTEQLDSCNGSSSFSVINPDVQRLLSSGKFILESIITKVPTVLKNITCENIL